MIKILVYTTHVTRNDMLYICYICYAVCLRSSHNPERLSKYAGYHDGKIIVIKYIFLEPQKHMIQNEANMATLHYIFAGSYGRSR